MEKEFELSSRHDGVLSKYTDGGLTIEEAADTIVNKPCDGNLSYQEVFDRLDSLEVGKNFCYYNGDFLQQFVIRTK